MLNQQLSVDQQILQLAAYAGKIVLTSGGEVYRVEEIVKKIGKKFNLEIECFATLTCVIISAKNPHGEVISLMERINGRTTNLHKIHKMHEIINNLEDKSFQEVRDSILEIENISTHSFRSNLLSSAIASGGFAIVFKGDIFDFIVAFIAGFLVGLFSKIASKYRFNTFFTNLISGAICGATSYIFFSLNLISTPSISIISSLMLLVPGVAFINCIRDIIAGDLVAGTSRITEVVMIGMAIAIGVGIIIKLFHGI